MVNSSKKNFLLFALGRMVSLIGTGIQEIAIPLYILDLTGSGAYMGIFTMLSLIPSLILMPFAGVIGDRFNRKKIMVSMDFINGAIILTLAMLTYFRDMSIPVLFSSQVLISLVSTMFGTSTSAMLPELVQEDELNKANSTMGGVNSFSMIIGPVLGGIIYGVWGIGFVFLLNGVSFVISAFSELFIKYVKTTEQKTELTAKAFFVEIKEGAKFVLSYKGLRYLFIFALVTNLIGSPLFSVVFPYVIRKVIKFSAQQFGLFETFFTIGMLIGNIGMAFVFSKFSTRKNLIFGMFLSLLMNIAFSFLIFPQAVLYFNGASWEFFGILAFTILMMGFANPIINVPIMTNMQKMVPNELRSRVFSVTGFVAQAGVPLGAVVYGFMLDSIPAHYVFLGASILELIFSFVIFLKAPKEMFDPNFKES